MKPRRMGYPDRATMRCALCICKITNRRKMEITKEKNRKRRLRRRPEMKKKKPQITQITQIKSVLQFRQIGTGCFLVVYVYLNFE